MVCKRNILFEEEKIKLQSKQQFVENKTDITQHGLNAVNFLVA